MIIFPQHLMRIKLKPDDSDVTANFRDAINETHETLFAPKKDYF
jgi:hypothetical protein